MLGGLRTRANAAPRTDKPFNAAVESFRAGRHSDAFGRFLALAGSGDADAANIALFMHQYGPILFGAYWDLATTDIAEFQEIAASGSLRKAPPFQPRLDAQKKSGLRK